LNRTTETSEEEILYLLEAITPSAKGRQYAVGFCYLTDGQEQGLRALLQKLPDAKLNSSSFSWTMYVGTARARGLGRINVHMQKLPQGHVGQEGIAERLDKFQPAADGVRLDPSHLYFSFVLRSPTLIRDKNDSVATLPESYTLANYLPRELQSSVQKWEILRKASAVETTTLTGWKQSWGLPKPVRYAVAAGSVWTYRVAETERHELLRVLDHIEVNGLGESRAEGLGELIVCDPFHVVFDAEEN
jgi:CRISPR-associated protein Csx10